MDALALIIALISICAAIVGIVLGVIALNQIKRTHLRGRGMAITGIYIGVAPFVVIAVSVVIALLRR